MYPSDPNFNAWLNERLRSVSLPVGLLERLRRVATASDAELDAALRDVPVPAGLHWRLERAARPRLSFARLADMALAASLLIAIGLSYLGVVAALLWAMYPVPARRRPELAAVELVGKTELGPAVIELAAAVEAGPGAFNADADLVAGPAIGPPQIALLRREEPARGWSKTWIDPFFPTASGPAADPLLDSVLGRWGAREVYGSHNAFDELPELKKVPSPVPQGITPPLVPGFDLGVFIRHHVHPFVSPAAHPKLRTSVVPLAIGTSSYELTRRYLEDGELPSPDAVRTEEFLAALDYEFPQPSRQPVGLSVAGGPSVFRGRDLRLLQIGVQGRQMGPKKGPGLICAKHPPGRSGKLNLVPFSAHLTLVVDVSSSMRWGGRLEMVRRAMRKLVDKLGEKDRVSLVAFSEYANVLIEDVNRDETDQLLEAVGTLSAGGSTNLGAGLRRAYAVAQRETIDERENHCVVLLTDGRAELDRGTADRIEKRLADAALRAVRLHVIDLGQDGAESQLDPLLSSFARAGDGRISRATSADQVCWALLEAITGRRQLVAADVRLKVTFNPKSVRAYRLLGHEAKAIAGLMPADPQTDFLAGQSANALYESSLIPGTHGEVAVAELSWRDPAGGKTNRLVSRIVRRQFSPSLLQAPLSLQAAAVAAETAEILRESPYLQATPKASSLARVLETAHQLDTRLYERPTFTELVSLIERAERAKPYRGGGRR